MNPNPNDIIIATITNIEDSSKPCANKGNVATEKIPKPMYIINDIIQIINKIPENTIFEPLILNF